MPDLLLLDEPTNHLDVHALTWLEQFLAQWVGSLGYYSAVCALLWTLHRPIHPSERLEWFAERWVAHVAHGRTVCRSAAVPH